MSDTTTGNPDDTPRGGRPPKLTAKLLGAVAELLLAGNFRYVAADRVGIGERTFRRWMRLGRLYPDGKYGAFRRAVILAETEAEARAVAAVVRAGKEDDPKYLCWWLERKFPQRWGRHRAELVELRRMIREVERMLGDVKGPPPAEGA